MLVIRCKAGEVVDVGDELAIRVVRLTGTRAELLIGVAGHQGAKPKPRQCRPRELLHLAEGVELRVARISSGRVELVFDASPSVLIKRRAAVVTTRSQAGVAA